MHQNDRCTDSEFNEGECLPEMPPTRDYFSEYKAEIDASEALLVTTRAELLTELRALGVKQVEIGYEGYDDSGNVEGVVFTPSSVTIAEDIYRRVDVFGWEFVYSFNPGFEIDCGGSGVLEWDIAADKIALTHFDHGSESGPREYWGL